MTEQEIGATEPLFTLELGSNGGTFAPHTASDIQQWLDTELKFWSWLSQLNQSGPARNLITQILANLENLRSQLRQTSGTLGGQVNLLGGIKSNLQNLYVQRSFPHSRSLMGQRVDELRKASPTRALHYLHAQVMNLKSDAIYIEGATLEVLAGYLVGIQDRLSLDNNAGGVTSAGQQAFNKVLGEAEEHLRNSRRQQDLQRQEFQAFISKATGDTKDQLEVFESQQLVREQLFDSSQESRHTSHKALEDALRKQMALREPVRYWSERARSHNQAAKAWKKYLQLAFPLLALVLAVFALQAFTAGTSGKPDPTISAVALVVGAVGFWATRLMVRMYLSHHHLKLDAEERQTMIMTYLALASDGQLPDSDDKKLVLAPLFRPASDGVVKEDGVVLPGLEALTRLPGNK